MRGDRHSNNLDSAIWFLVFGFWLLVFKALSFYV